MKIKDINWVSAVTLLLIILFNNFINYLFYKNTIFWGIK